MTQDLFFRQALRITVMQILRGIGFDRAENPQIVDILTDLYIRHLLLITAEAQSLSQTSGREAVEIQDITQALVNCGMLKPSNLLDAYELYYQEDQTAKSFLSWVVGHVSENQRTVSRPESLLKLQEKKDPREPTEPQVIDDNWLEYTLRQGVTKSGSVRMYDVTELRPTVNVKSDPTVVGSAPDELVDKLPTNIKQREKEVEEEILQSAPGSNHMSY